MSDEQTTGDGLEREFADVLVVLRRFEPAPATAGFEARVEARVEEKVTMTLEQVKPVEPMISVERREVAGVSLRCTYCHAALARDDASFCAGCLAPHHDGCWVEHGRCSAPGCAETRVVRPRDGVQRSSRKNRPTRRWSRLLLVTAGLTMVVGLSVAMRSWRLEHHEASVAYDERAMFEEFKRLKEEGLRAFGEFNVGEKRGNAALSRAKHAEAHEKLVRAMDLLTRILDNHRDPVTSFTHKDYEGYEVEQSEVAHVLVDLEKREPDAQLHDPRPSVEVAPATESMSSDQFMLVAEANALLREGRLEEALAKVERALALDPAAAFALQVRAEIRVALDDPQGALADLSRAIEVRPSHETYRARGRVSLELGRFDAALLDLLHASQLKPGDPAAIEDFTAVVRLAPTRDDAWYGLARAHVQLGDDVRARAALDRAIELNPAVASYYAERGQVRARCGDPAGAEADAARADEVGRSGVRRGTER